MPKHDWLDEWLDDLWGRALDMTSPDFANDDDYLKAKTNYRNYSKKQLAAKIVDIERRGRIDEINRVQEWKKNSFNPKKVLPHWRIYRHNRLMELKALGSPEGDGE